MAVVPSGFGSYFNQYSKMADSRQWNTTNYDYAVVRNKGDISNFALDEKTEKALTVKVDKTGYYNANGGFISDLKNPIYQIRDFSDITNNDYYREYY